MTNFKFTSIAIVHSPYKDKFAVPRQAGLVPSATAELEMLSPFDDINAFNGLEGYSHLWLLFSFHKNNANNWSPTVRPPRLGGNKRVGVFATRSPNRPNNIGLSLVEFHGIEKRAGKVYLQLGSVDLVQGTPILDIKPYIPYADARPNARADMAAQAPTGHLAVNFSQQATSQLIAHANTHQDLQQFISEVLQQDPRPAYKKQKTDNKIYGMKLYNFDISWQLINEAILVHSIDPI